MLSRVAHSLYWLTRYVDRAENTARLVDVNLQLLLDVRPSGEGGHGERWLSLVESSGEEELFKKLHPEANSLTVTEFLMFQGENPNSVLSSIIQARENARMVRDQLSSELWEEINRLYLFLRAPDARRLMRHAPHDLFREIKNGALLFQGLMDATLLRQEGWLFMRVGRYLERADKSSRLLDVRHATWPRRGIPGPGDPGAAMGWSAVLRSASAWEAYRSLYGTEVTPENVIQLLMLSDDFPRSLRFCVRELNLALRSISGVAENRFTNEAEKLAGRLLAELTFSSVEDLCVDGLHERIDSLQARLNAIGDAVFRTYIDQTFEIPGDFELRQQEEQQQQASPRSRAP